MLSNESIKLWNMRSTSMKQRATPSAIHFARWFAARVRPALGPRHLPPRRTTSRQSLSTLNATAATTPVIYLNRLGDLLFVLARAANQKSGVMTSRGSNPRLEGTARYRSSG